MRKRKKSRKGIMYYNNGEKYDGEWKERDKDRIGIFYWSEI